MNITYNDGAQNALRRKEGGYVTAFFPSHPVTGDLEPGDIDLMEVLR